MDLNRILTGEGSQYSDINKSSHASIVLPTPLVARPQDEIEIAKMMLELADASSDHQVGTGSPPNAYPQSIPYFQPNYPIQTTPYSPNFQFTQPNAFNIAPKGAPGNQQPQMASHIMTLAHLKTQPQNFTGFPAPQHTNQQLLLQQQLQQQQLQIQQQQLQQQQLQLQVQLAQKQKKQAAKRGRRPSQSQEAPGAASGSNNNNNTNNNGSSRRVVTSPSGLPCPNCGIDTSTLWRTCELQNGSQYLCNACGLRYKKGKYCPICYKVYYDADTNQLTWQQCISCLNWSHKACVEQKGYGVNGGYICPSCKRDNTLTNPNQKTQLNRPPAALPSLGTPSAQQQLAQLQLHLQLQQQQQQQPAVQSGVKSPCLAPGPSLPAFSVATPVTM